MSKSKCELCRIYENREIHTKIYYEDQDWIILDCKTCHIPMIVYKEHKILKDIPIKYIHYMINECMELFGTIRFRTERKIKNHFHWHIIIEEEDYE